MPHDQTPDSRLKALKERLGPASEGMLHWLPIGAGAVIVLVIGAVFWIGGERAPERITIATGTSGGTYDALGRVIADALGEADPPIRAQTAQSGGATENAQRVALSADTLGLVQSNTRLERDVQLLARLYPEVYHLLARTDAGLSGVADLAGRRVALMPEGSGSNAAFYQLLDHYQVPRGAVSAVPGSLSGGLGALAAGKVDALFVIIALGNETIAEAIRTADIEVLGLDQAQAIALFDPAVARMEIPKGVYSGNRPVPRESIDVLSVDALLVANAALPDEIANAIVTTLFERRQQMVAANRQAAFISEPTAQQRLAIGVHAGAQSYYQRDEPSFLVEYAEPLSLGLSVLVLLASGLWQGRIWLSGARKNRADRYNLQIAGLVERIQNAATLAELDALRSELFGIFHEVIADLDDDRIEEASLQSFSFSWDVAQSTLAQRCVVLAGQEAAKPAPRKEAKPASRRRNPARGSEG